MSDLKEKLKRQTEILGLALARPNALSRADLEIAFERDRPTINRDLAALRESGIDIHSTKKGIRISSRVTRETLGEIILQYVGLNYSALSYDKATSSLVRRQRERALVNIVSLQRCIDTGTIAAIDYEKKPGKVEQGKIIAPWILFQEENEWRVLAENGGIRKQYLVCKMKSITPTERTFRKPSQETLRTLFEPAWGAWLGGGKTYDIRIHFNQDAMLRYGHRQFVETQQFVKNADGSAVLEAKVNSLNEVAGWIVSHSAWVKALEPMELKAKVVDLAKGALRNHSR